jgi:hypothetical protein
MAPIIGLIEYVVALALAAASTGRSVAVDLAVESLTY